MLVRSERGGGEIKTRNALMRRKPSGRSTEASPAGAYVHHTARAFLGPLPRPLCAVSPVSTMLKNITFNVGKAYQG